ncbi:MAG: hypothetical protein EPO35_09190 [Acidobacteria bacterium]|nr:MAG: hypothetical protein EPO35_09190 [Acidobacteriota bacterium]
MTNDFDNLDEFKDLIDEVKSAGEVPEPSPLFWHHLSARVREAVAAEPIPGPWWMMYWRPVLAAVGTVAVVGIIVWSQPAHAPALAVAVNGSNELIADVEVSEMWRLIEVASPNVPLESAAEAGLMPTSYATDQAIAALSPADREKLVRLLRKEMGVSE